MIATCPECGSVDLQSSRSKSVADRVLRAVGFPPRRCSACGWRGVRPRAFVPVRKESRSDHDIPAAKRHTHRSGSVKRRERRNVAYAVVVGIAVGLAMRSCTADAATAKKAAVARKAPAKKASGKKGSAKVTKPTLTVAMTPAALQANTAHDVVFELTLTNRSAKPLTLCTAGARPEGKVSWPMEWAIRVLPGNDAAVWASPDAWVKGKELLGWLWSLPGAPAPPDLSAMFAKHKKALGPGKSISYRWEACWIPRSQVPFASLSPSVVEDLPGGRELKGAAVLVLDANCETMAQARAELGAGMFRERVVALFPKPGPYQLQFSYTESQAYGFRPAQELFVESEGGSVEVP